MKNMSVAKLLKLFFIALFILICVSCDNKELKIKRVNYRYNVNSVDFYVEMENTTDYILLFPSSMRDQIRQLKRNGNAEIFLNECKLEFKNAKEMIAFEESKTSLDDEKHTNEFSYMFINPVFPGDTCVYSGYIKYKEIPREEIEKKKIKILLKYGKGVRNAFDETNECSYLGTDKRVRTKEITLALPIENQVKRFDIPDVQYGPVWDTDKWPSPFGRIDDDSVSRQYVPETYLPAETMQGMEITFYYNPVVYTEFRTEELVKKGDCEIKKSFLYEELSEGTCINDVLREKPVFVDDSEKEGFYKNLIECLCIIKQGNEEIVKFTFSENPNQLYSLCNGRLIKRNEIYDKFSNEMIELIKKSEDRIK